MEVKQLQLNCPRFLSLSQSQVDLLFNILDKEKDPEVKEMREDFIYQINGYE